MFSRSYNKPVYIDKSYASTISGHKDEYNCITADTLAFIFGEFPANWSHASEF